MKYHRVIQYSLDYVGARKFLVGTLEQFYEIYSHLDEIHRHHYETIQSTWFYTGKPCNLYFDVEFERNLNPNAKGDAMVTIFVQFVSEFLHRRYDFEGLDVVDLESSSDTKFSRHLIFRIHKAYLALI